MNPHATNHPVSYFRKFHQMGALDLSPSFQRNPVWSEAQASYLVDSILNELPFPEIYVRSITDAEGETKLEVIDGQQRLRSIISFYSDDLQLTGDDVTSMWKGTSWGKLSTEQRESFWAYKIVVREMEGASDSEVRDMFRRLNANQSSLNQQELRHSQYHGEFITTVERIANNQWWLDNKIVTPSQIRRMLDIEFISELMVGLISGPLDKKKGLDEYYLDYDSEFPDSDYWEEIFDSSRGLTKLLVGGDLKGWTSKTEYYSLFIAVGLCVYEDVVPKGKSRTEAKNRLQNFRKSVNDAKRKGNSGNHEDNVERYVEAVSRASTDLRRRLERVEIIRNLILGCSS